MPGRLFLRVFSPGSLLVWVGKKVDYRWFWTLRVWEITLRQIPRGNPSIAKGVPQYQKQVCVVCYSLDMPPEVGYLLKHFQHVLYVLH